MRTRRTCRLRYAGLSAACKHIPISRYQDLGLSYSWVGSQRNSIRSQIVVCFPLETPFKGPAQTSSCSGHLLWCQG